MAKQGVAKAGKAGTKAAAVTRAGGVGAAGSAILGAAKPKPKPGVGSAGSALLGSSGKGNGAKSTLGAAPPAAAGAAAPTVQPFLTDAQQKALSDWNASYGEKLGSLTQADTNAQAKWTSDTGAENLKFANNNDLTNQAEAARGLYQSSIRENALNDLAVTHAAAINTINTNRDTALNNDQISRQDLAGQNTDTQNYYEGLAVGNAQAVTPVTGDNAGVAGTAGAAGAAPPASAAAVAPPPPAQTRQAQTQQVLTTRANAQQQQQESSSGMHAAALTRVQQPKPKAPGSNSGIGAAAGLFGNLTKGVGAPR